MSRRHNDLLAYAAQRDTDAETARTARDKAPRGSYERGVYAQAYEDAKADARQLRSTVADEQWRSAK